MKWFRDDDWTWNSLRQPYRILERYPDLAFIEPHLQVMWYFGRYHPTWWKNYHDERVSHLAPPEGQRPLDWRNDTFSFHFTKPHPFQTPGEFLTNDCMYAKMGRMILEAANMVNIIGCHVCLLAVSPMGTILAR